MSDLGLLVLAVVLVFHVSANVRMPRVTDGEAPSEASRDQQSMVSLWYSSSGAEVDRTFVCGGYLVEDEYVLTASSCFTGRTDFSKWCIFEGRFNLNPPALAYCFSVEKLIEDGSYDISLVKTTLTRHSGTAPSPCLDHDHTCSGNGAECKVLGWGYRGADGGTGVLMRGYMNATSVTSCPSGGETLNDQDHLCVQGGASVCSGDQGGPVICYCARVGGGWRGRPRVAAIIGGISGSTTCHQHTYFTRVSALLDEIYNDRGIPITLGESSDC